LNQYHYYAYGKYALTNFDKAAHTLCKEKERMKLQLANEKTYMHMLVQEERKKKGQDIEAFQKTMDMRLKARVDSNNVQIEALAKEAESAFNRYISTQATAYKLTMIQKQEWLSPPKGGGGGGRPSLPPLGGGKPPCHP
jgi:exonuclease VII large subunit